MIYLADSCFGPKFSIVILCLSSRTGVRRQRPWNMVGSLPQKIQFRECYSYCSWYSQLKLEADRWMSTWWHHLLWLNLICISHVALSLSISPVSCEHIPKKDLCTFKVKVNLCLVGILKCQKIQSLREQNSLTKIKEYKTVQIVSCC